MQTNLEQKMELLERTVKAWLQPSALINLLYITCQAPKSDRQFVIHWTQWRILA